MKPDLNTCRYVPVLRARAGETQAVSELFEKQKSRVLPLFDVYDPKPGLGNKDIPVWLRQTMFPYVKLIDKRISELVNLNLPIVVDCFNFDLDDELAPCCLAYQHVFWKAISDSNLLIPCIGYDRWADSNYRSFLQTAITNRTPETLALRLDRSALDDLGPDQYFTNVITDMVKVLGIDTSSCIAIVDLGDLTELDQIDTVEQVSEIVGVCKLLGFAMVSVGGSSFPDSVSKAVKENWDSAVVSRLEKELFVDVAITCGHERLALTDYGVRNPRSHEGGGSNANGKIRYTTKEGHFTVRGTFLYGDKRTGRVGYGFKQMYQLAADVVVRSSYSGANFSWGDAEILKRALVHEKPGGLPQWIAFDTNRHISFVGLEVTRMLAEMQTAVSFEREDG